MKNNEIDLRHILVTNVRVARAEQRISQEELALGCGIHRNYIGAIERAECNITLETLMKLAIGLSIKPHSLIQ